MGTWIFGWSPLGVLTCANDRDMMYQYHSTSTNGKALAGFTPILPRGKPRAFSDNHRILDSQRISKDAAMFIVNDRKL
jgi:hypothetical protein